MFGRYPWSTRTSSSSPKQTFEPRRLSTSHHSCSRDFGQSFKIKDPEIGVTSPTVTTKDTKQKEVIWQQYHLCLGVAQHQILGGKHFLIFGAESGKIWWLKKVQYLKKKYHCKWTLLRGETFKWIFFIILATCSNHLSSCQPLVSMWFQRNGKSDQFLEIEYPKVISTRAPQYRQHALISDFLDLAKLSIQEEAALATSWIKGFTLQNLALATMTGQAVRSQSNITADVKHAINKCEALGSGKQSIIHGNPSAIARWFCRSIWPFFDVMSCRTCTSIVVC